MQRKPKIIYEQRLLGPQYNIWPFFSDFFGLCFGLLKVGLSNCHLCEKCIWCERRCRVFGQLARKWIREALAPGFWESGVSEPLLQSCCLGLWWTRWCRRGETTTGGRTHWIIDSSLVWILRHWAGEIPYWWQLFTCYLFTVLAWCWIVMTEWLLGLGAP